MFGSWKRKYLVLLSNGKLQIFDEHKGTMLKKLYVLRVKSDIQVSGGGAI